MNVWTFDEAAHSAENILKAAIPFQEDWSTAMQTAALARYISYLSEQLIHQSRSSFCQSWLKIRFEPLSGVDGVQEAYTGPCGSESLEGRFGPEDMERGAAPIRSLLEPLPMSTKVLFLQDLVEEVGPLEVE